MEHSKDWSARRKKDTISKKEYKALTQKKKKKNKYNAVRQTYNGKSYDSGLEASYARQLDFMKKAGEVKEWTPQKTLKLVVNGFLVCRYSLDFHVIYTDGREEYWEVKSRATKTEAWANKWKLAKALFPDYKFVLKEKY